MRAALVAPTLVLSLGALALPARGDVHLVPEPNGPLSGKTVWATVVFVVAWIVLQYLWRGRDRMLRSATIAFVVLTLLGLLGTFPIFFQAFAPE